MGGDIRKPWMELAGQPIIYRTCRRLREVEGVSEIILALHPDDVDRAQNELWDDLTAAGVSMIVAGGANRAESVWNAVQVVAADSELIAVHDAVRPFISPVICEQLFKMAARRGAAVPIVPLADTVKRVEADLVVETPRRLGMVRVQTPQVFSSDLFIDACEYALSTGGFTDSITDDASLVERYGKEVAVILGEEYNFKITTPRDLKIAEALFATGVC
jgi:2-C-methyl-D-erythritol 4-phosphate cytidylyltransferase